MKKYSSGEIFAGTMIDVVRILISALLISVMLARGKFEVPFDAILFIAIAVYICNAITFGIYLGFKQAWEER